jgi:hypothetical protein
MGKGLFPILRVLWPGIALELASSVLLAFWLGAGKLWGMSGIVLHFAAVWSIWTTRPDTQAGSDPKTEARPYVFTLAAMIVAFFPVAGLLGFATAMYIKSRSRKKGLVEVLSGEMHTTCKKLGIERVEDFEDFLMKESRVEPIREILKGSDAGLKRGAISFLGSMHSPLCVELLKESLSDANSEVRFYAHAAMTKIDDAFSQEIKAAEAALDENDCSSFTALGIACIRYADSGLVEEVMRAQFLEKAVSAISHAAALSPDDSTLRVHLGSLYLEMGEYAKAQECFESVAEDLPGFVDASLGLCKIYYDLRDFDSLYLLRRRLSLADCADCDPAKRITYKFWSHSGGAS